MTTDHKSSIKDLKSSIIETPIGSMLALADSQKLYLLEFLDRKKLAVNLQKLNSLVSPGETKITSSIRSELDKYFAGSLKKFSTPYIFRGTSFQKLVWTNLLNVSFGETKSYLEIASEIYKSSASRAVANAVGANQLAIIIPCHRIINSNGKIGGYAGGVERKKWLLTHEKIYFKSC